MGDWLYRRAPDERLRQQLRDAECEAARFRVRHMNDTKWREVFETLQAFTPTIQRVEIKFTGRPGASSTCNCFRSVTEVWCDGPFGPFMFREVEWLRIPATYVVPRGRPGTPPLECVQETKPLAASLNKLGRLPMRDVAGGIQIIGYE